MTDPACFTVAPPPNALPTVTLTSPSSGATYDAPKLIPLTATASDSDGTIVEVTFYAGATLIGSDTVPPYGVTWSVSSGGAGTYQVTATARDNAGGTRQSGGVTVTIRPPTGRYKLDGSGGCYWDANDSGPNQCSPGRWKLDGQGGCYWDQNDSGPNQCSPGQAPADEEVRR